MKSNYVLILSRRKTEELSAQKMDSIRQGTAGQTNYFTINF
jgi:hypothetical protein